MKNIRFGVLLHLTLLFELRLFGRNKLTNSANTAVSKYDYHDAFAPHFYSKNGTSTRSASGQLAEYWQNRADYQLTAKLDENNEISEQELLYTNNSPDKMAFVWI
jgi:hypothetical protein